MGEITHINNTTAHIMGEIAHINNTTAHIRGEITLINNTTAHIRGEIRKATPISIHNLKILNYIDSVLSCSVTPLYSLCMYAYV